MAPNQQQRIVGNLLLDGCCGCHIIDENSDRIFGVVNVENDNEHNRTSLSDELDKHSDTRDVEDEDNPVDWYIEAIESEQGILCVVNMSSSTIAAYVSVISELAEELDIYDSQGKLIQAGFTKSSRKEPPTPCVTFVLVLQPKSGLKIAKGKIHNWKKLNQHVFSMGFSLERPSFLTNPNPYQSVSGEDLPLVKLPQFPISGNDAWLCTQGAGGRLTHFFKEGLHAIDIRCPAGTQLVAVADCVVVDVQQAETTTGIHSSNLWSWNAVSVLADISGGICIDYVHILANSCKFKKGDVVKSGEVLCLSGAVGFAPEPHLHIEVHSKSDPQGPSLPFGFVSKLSPDKFFIPMAGEWYNENGEVEPETKRS